MPYNMVEYPVIPHLKNLLLKLNSSKYKNEKNIDNRMEKGPSKGKLHLKFAVTDR